MARDITDQVITDLPPSVSMATIRITPTDARRTVTTARIGSLMAFSSARAPGSMAGAGAAAIGMIGAGAGAIGMTAAGAGEVGKAEVLEADLTTIEDFAADSAAEGLKGAADSVTEGSSAAGMDSAAVTDSAVAWAAEVVLAAPTAAVDFMVVEVFTAAEVLTAAVTGN